MAISKITCMKDCGKSYHGKHLRAALAYITVPEKTQQGRLVAGINCVPEFAFEQMKETKRKYGKLDKRQGYHLVLSFKENEVTQDTAMELTSRFVKEYLGSEYEAVYAVHDNTRHIHAHIVFNSVSFLTGKKYRYEKGDWAREIQPITNRLCQEYGLSTIEIEDDKLNQDVEYRETRKEQAIQHVWNSAIRRDLDACIILSATYEEFQRELTERGYECKEGKYLAIRPPGMKRFRRTQRLGEDYTIERIQERIETETLRSVARAGQSHAPWIVGGSVRRLENVDANFQAMAAATTDFVATCDGQGAAISATVSLYNSNSQSFSDSESLPPQGSGYIVLMLMVPKNWKELQVTYMPTFAPDKTLTFTMKAADVIRG